MRDEMEAEFNRAAGTDGWKMVDTPKMAEPEWQKLIETFGDENVRFMVGSSGNFRIENGRSVPCEPWRRGTLLVSPKGMERARAFEEEEGLR